MAKERILAAQVYVTGGTPEKHLHFAGVRKKLEVQRLDQIRAALTAALLDNPERQLHERGS